MGRVALGMMLFFFAFVSHISLFADSSNFEARAAWDMKNGLAGGICIVLGQFVMRLGRSGLAGSGLKLDPQEARKDLEPWSRMTGGMLKDALDEADIDLKHPSHSGGLPFDEKMRRLESLKRDGLITEEEFATARQKILDSLEQ